MTVSDKPDNAHESDNAQDSPRRRQHPAVRALLITAGWLLVVAGIAALFLPGPGMLMLFAGLALLSQEYAWAQKRVDVVKHAALHAASEGVQNWRRWSLSFTGIAIMIAAGIYWGIRPPVPSWWPVADKWWLVGGWATGATILVSASAALALLVYSWQRFRGAPYQPGDSLRHKPKRHAQQREHNQPIRNQELLGPEVVARDVTARRP